MQNYRLYPGDMAIFNANKQATEGDIVLATLKNNEAIIRLYKEVQDGYFLLSNESQSDILFVPQVSYQGHLAHTVGKSDDGAQRTSDYESKDDERAEVQPKPDHTVIRGVLTYLLINFESAAI